MAEPITKEKEASLVTADAMAIPFALTKAFVPGQRPIPGHFTHGIYSATHLFFLLSTLYFYFLEQA